MALAVVPLGQAPSLTGSITPHPREERDFLILYYPGKGPVRRVSLETLWWAVGLPGGPVAGKTVLTQGLFT